MKLQPLISYLNFIYEYHTYIWYDIECDIRYDIQVMTSASLRPAATLCSARADHSSNGLAVSLPSLSCPDPALTDTLAPDPLSLCYGHHVWPLQ